MRKKKIDEDKRVQYMRISLGMSGVGVGDMTAEIILRVFEAVEKAGGNFDLETSTRIQVEVEEKYAARAKPVISIAELEKYCVESEKNKDLDVEGILNGLKEIIETNREIPI